MKKPLFKRIFLLLLLFASFKVAAEGSKELASNGGDRAHWRSSTASSPQFPFPSLGIIKVYAKVGETIFLGSSAQGYVGSTAGTMNWKAPDGSVGTSGASTTVGRIENRAQESFGPSLTLGDGGYTPYAVVVGAGQEGVWEITFISTSLTAAGGNAPISPVNDELVQNPNGFYIEAFDVSIKSTANALVPGRAFMNIFSGNTSNVANIYGSFKGIFHVLTKDGYQYTVNANGMQGAAFQFFSNNKGFRDTNQNASYKSVLNVGTTAATIPVHNPTTADDATNVTHKLFFNAPALDLPVTAPSVSGPVWLDTTIINPTLSIFSFKGTEGTTNLAGTTPLGGTFTFRSSVTGAYKISIDINKNGSFTDAADRFITGYTNVVNTDIVTPWDGLDGLGVKVPGNTSFPPSTIKIELLSGEVHFPLLDVERNPSGIIVTRLNGNNLPDDVLYWDDSDITNAGTASTPKKNLTGISSSTNGHIWNGTGATNFGDNNGMDSWGYIPSTPLLNPLAFRIAEADLEVISITSNSSTVCEGTTGTFVVSVRNNGPDNVTGAKFHIDMPTALTATTVVYFAATGASQVITPTLLASSYDATLNMDNAAVITFTINTTVSAVPTAGFLAFKASMLRPADVTDPDATNPDAAIPTDPDQECDAAPSGIGCNNIKAVQITVNAALVTVPLSTVVQPSCAVATGSITVTAPVGVGFTYSIDGTSYQTSAVFSGVTPGVHSIQVKNTGGCESPIASVTINVQPATPIPPVVQNISYCQGNPAIALQATGQQIKWYLTEKEVNPLPTPPVPDTATPGTTTWWASQTIPGGCESARVPLTVTINPKPILTLISSTADMAVSDPPRLLAVTPAGGTFTGPGVILNGNTTTFNPTTAGPGSHVITYTYVGTGNCSATLQFTVKVLAAIKVDLTVSIVTDSRPIGVGEVFNYTITASNKSTENATDARTTIKLPPGLSFVDVQTSFGNATYDQSSGLLTWTIGALPAEKSETLKLRVKAVEPGKYTVATEISSKEQDSTPANNNSSVDKEILGLFIPDVITPNGDGKNDQLKVRGLEMYPVHELNILNRWGNSIYHSAAYKNDWTGEGLNDGTYYYALRVKTTSGKWLIFKGYITLLRNR